MKEDLKNIFLMGLGAMSLTSEKAKELKEQLLEKGNKLYQDGKVANEELKHNIEEKIKENITIKVEKNTSKEDIIKAIKEMTKEEKNSILNILKEETEQSKENIESNNE